MKKINIVKLYIKKNIFTNNLNKYKSYIKTNIAKEQKQLKNNQTNQNNTKYIDKTIIKIIQPINL